MAKVLSSNVNVSSRVQNKRKVLKVIQVSADEQGIAGNMVKPGEETLPSTKQINTTEKAKVIEKENSGPVRRSKRTATTSNSVNYVELPEDSKTTKSVAKTTKSVAKTTKSVAKTTKSVAKTTKSVAKTTKSVAKSTKSADATKSKKTAKSKKGSTAVKKNEQTKLNQTKLNFSSVEVNMEEQENTNKHELDHSEKCVSTATHTEDDSGYAPSCGASEDPVNSTAIIDDIKMDIPDDILMITSENPPLKYWQILAEERRIALEKALLENESLHDQLEVLETENSQLKQLLREAENLALVVKSIIE